MHESERLPPPQTDPTAIFEHFRGSYGTELLAAAVAHFDLFRLLGQRPLTFDELRAELKLEERPATVLVTALRAMELLDLSGSGRLKLTTLAREHLTPGAAHSVSDYIGLISGTPGVREMVHRLRTNRPMGADPQEAVPVASDSLPGGTSTPGTAFIYRSGVPSAMEQEELARHFTLALAGRAKNVAPVLAEWADPGAARLILDVGGGTGIYSIALLRRFPQMRAIVLDRPEVLKVADEFAREYEVADRLEFRAGDMFVDSLPAADIVLLSNVLHDWDIPECRELVARAAAVLPPAGELWIHDVFLNDALDGPLPIALYSAALFTLTEGRAYSAAEYRSWLVEAGLAPKSVVPTLIHCGLLVGMKRG